MKYKIVLFLKIIWSVFLVFGGIQHHLKPEFYIAFVPAFLPFTLFFVYASGVLEILLGMGLWVRKFGKWAALGSLLLMLAFLPVHIGDVFSENPAIGSEKAALIRLPVQFLFIVWAWLIYRFEKKK